MSTQFFPVPQNSDEVCHICNVNNVRKKDKSIDQLISFSAFSLCAIPGFIAGVATTVLIYGIWHLITIHGL